VQSESNILLIEDDPAVAQSLRDGLERAGHAVTWKSSGAAGIQAATQATAQDRPHLIILDVRLPDGSGFDFCRRMRQLGLRQPVLILTVQADELDKVLGLDMGADDYMTKPYSLRELLSRVRALLRRTYGELAPGSTAGDADLVFAGDLTIDRGRAQVHRGDQPIALTPIEFRLLAFLAQRPGQAFTRAQLLDAVWGYTADAESEKIVNVNVRRLREKVELDPARPTLILTVPGVGYRLAG
jgi:DNA-binding response OmpR family regulator